MISITVISQSCKTEECLWSTCNMNNRIPAADYRTRMAEVPQEVGHCTYSNTFKLCSPHLLFNSALLAPGGVAPTYLSTEGWGSVPFPTWSPWLHDFVAILWGSGFHYYGGNYNLLHIIKPSALDVCSRSRCKTSEFYHEALRGESDICGSSKQNVYC